jgi:hypothetical protein
MSESECCPKFNPKIWDEKKFEWKNKKFIKDKIFSIFNIPVNFGNVMKKMMQKIDFVNANCVDYLMLSDHTSNWNIDQYIAVNKNIPNASNTTISGKFYSKVYEGDFSSTGNWYKDFLDNTRKKKLNIEKIYFWYTTCPKCAKKYGKNYVVIIGKIK